MVLVVAEKPSVARSIRKAINGDFKAVALSGHILDVDFPREYGSWWKTDPKDLFNAPVRWVVRDRKAYRELVEALREHGDLIVLATDNDHEGELIAYEVLLIAKDILGKVRYARMRFNSTTPRELKKAWENLEPDLNWGWVWKAQFRRMFDLVTGAAYTRLLTTSARRAGEDVKLISWGSCQTPTLWFVSEREKQIREFKPQTYYTIEATVLVDGVEVRVSSPTMKNEEEAKKLFEKAREADRAEVTSFGVEQEVERRPLPTDTDSMLQDLAKALGLSASKIMALAEELYADGYISYPRTETNQWVGVNHRWVLEMLKNSHLSNLVKLDSINPRSGSKNDGAHPPIHPTQPYPHQDLKARVWEYVARRYLANVVYGDAVFNRWRLSVSLGGVELSASNRYFVDEGFYQVFPYFRPKQLLWIPEARLGQLLPVKDVELAKKKTKPPPHLTEAELLRLLEAHGIGTDATRHEYPSIIVRRGYAEKRGKSFRITELGELLMNLLANVDRRLVTPETRKHVEEMMKRVEKGELTMEEALKQSLQIYEELFAELESALRGNEKVWVRERRAPEHQRL